MSRATSKMRDFAESLIEYETKGNKSSTTEGSSAFLVCEKLRPQLATLMGSAGFRALVLRALALSSAEVSWLRAVHVKADGSFEGLEEQQAKLDPDEFSEGRVVLLAQLLGLLVAFIGEILTLQLVRDVWPKLPFKNLGFDRGGG